MVERQTDEAKRRYRPLRPFRSVLFFLLLQFFLVGTAGALDLFPPPSDLNLKDLHGNITKLSDFKGKVVIINFWATWCIPCKEEMPELVAIYQKYREKGLVIIGISLDTRIEKLPPFIKQFGITYPTLLGNTKIVERWGIRGIPMTFVINQKGRVFEYYNGPVKMASLEKVIGQLLEIHTER